MLAALLLLACAAPPEDSGTFSFPFEPDTPCREAPSVSIGNGDRDWQPLADGDPIAIRFSGNVGWYVPLSLETRGLAEGLSLRAVGTLPDEEVPLFDVSFQVKVRLDSACTGYLSEVYAYLSSEPDLEELDGAPLVLSVDVRDDLGEEVSASVEGVASVTE